MKIIAFLNSYSQGKSGGDVFFVEVARRLKSYKWLVVTSALGEELCRNGGVEAEYLITTREAEFGNAVWIYFKRIIGFFCGGGSRIRDYIRNDVALLATSDFLPDVLPCFWLKLWHRKTRWVQHIFHLIPTSRVIPYLAQQLSLWLIKPFADAIVVDNSLLAEELARRGFSREKIHLIYPGISLDYLSSITGEGARGYDGVFLGRLHESKGVFDLVEIWEQVCAQVSGARLGVIGGDVGGNRVRLEELIRQRGLENNIFLLGYLSDDEAFAAIKASRVFVFPSHEEGFGIAPLEAQALGLPVVAWDLPVFAEVFPKGMVRVRSSRLEAQGSRSKFKTQNRPLVDFAGEVARLLVDEEHYTGVAKGARENAERFDWEEAAQREEQLLVA